MYYIIMSGISLFFTLPVLILLHLAYTGTRESREDLKKQITKHSVSLRKKKVEIWYFVPRVSGCDALPCWLRGSGAVAVSPDRGIP